MDDLPQAEKISMFLVTYPRGGYEFFTHDQNLSAPRAARENNGRLFKVQIVVTDKEELDPEDPAPSAEF